MADQNDVLICPIEKHHIKTVKEIASLSHSHLSSRLLIEEDIKNKIAHIFVALVDDRVVGFIDYWSAHREINIINIAVHPDFKRNKIGSRLMREMLLKEEGFEQIILEVRSGNKRAIEFYRSHGFNAIGLRKNYYRDGENAVVMELRVNPRPVPSGSGLRVKHEDDAKGRKDDIKVTEDDKD